MAFRSDVSVDFIASPRVITIASPSVAIIGQDLVDTLRVIEKNILNLIYPKLLDAEGKSDLSGGFFTGITVKMQNALLAFAARPGPSTVQCDVSQCNLVAVDSVGASMSPISPTAFTQVVIRQSTSPALVTSGGSAVTAQDKIDIVNQTWDAVRSGHVTAGSFGETLDARVSSRSVYAGGAVASVTGAVGSIATGGITAPSFGVAAIDALALATDAGQEIADLVWNSTRSTHVVAGSFGEVLDAKVTSRSSQSRPQRGQALPNLTFVMFDSSTRSPKIGLTVAGQVSKDGAAFAAMAGAPVEIGQGVYRASLNATEMTADVVTALFTGTGAEPQVVTMVTAP